MLTDEGRTVTVNGGPSGTGTGTDTNTATSVDRTYRPGVRYEFHPLNAASPYQDNACTATRAIGGASGESRLPEGTSPVASGLTSGVSGQR